MRIKNDEFVIAINVETEETRMAIPKRPIYRASQMSVLLGCLVYQVGIWTAISGSDPKEVLQKTRQSINNALRKIPKKRGAKSRA